MKESIQDPQGEPVLSASQEDYLEAISQIAGEDGVARAKEIADILGVQRASVTGALRMLRDNGMIHYTPYANVTLTEQGRARARGIIHRHETLRRFFQHILAIEGLAAEEVACKVEHAVSDTVMDRLTLLLDYIEHAPEAGQEWVAGFHALLQETDAGR